MTERQSQAAPAPDYGSGILESGPPDPEPCSCDEALALRARVRELEYATGQLRLVIDALESKLAAAENDEREWDAMRADRDEWKARSQQTEELNGGLLHRAWTLEARVRELQGTLSPATSARTRNGWSSRFKGVYWHAKSARWRARVLVGGKRVSLGAFPSEDEAASAVDCAMKAKGGLEAKEQRRG